MRRKGQPTLTSCSVDVFPTTQRHQRHQRRQEASQWTCWCETETFVFVWRRGQRSPGYILTRTKPVCAANMACMPEEKWKLFQCSTQYLSARYWGVHVATQRPWRMLAAGVPGWWDGGSNTKSNIWLSERQIWTVIFRLRKRGTDTL